MEKIELKPDVVKIGREYRLSMRNYIEDEGTVWELILIDEDINVLAQVSIGKNEILKTVDEFNQKCSDLFEIELFENESISATV